MFETGTVAISDTIDNGVSASVSFQQSYSTPVIVTYIATRAGDQSIDSRAKDLSSTGCTIFIEEPDDEGHVEETVSYIVAEAGTREIDGLKIEAGVHTTNTVRTDSDGSNFGDTVTFSQSWSSVPAVLHDLQTYNNGDWITTQSNSVTTDDFNLSQEAAQTGQESTVVEEDLSWIAFEIVSGGGSIGPVTFETNAENDGTGDGVDDTPHTISFSASFSSTPDITVAGNTMNGTDGFWARSSGTQWDTTGHETYSEEDQVVDTERGHVDETFGYIATDPDSVVAEATVSTTTVTTTTRTATATTSVTNLAHTSAIINEAVVGTSIVGDISSVIQDPLAGLIQAGGVTESSGGLLETSSTDTSGGIGSTSTTSDVILSSATGTSDLATASVDETASVPVTSSISSSTTATASTTTTADRVVEAGSATPITASTGQTAISQVGPTRATGTDVIATADIGIAADVGPQSAIGSGSVSMADTTSTTIAIVGTASAPSVLSTADTTTSAGIISESVASPSLSAASVGSTSLVGPTTSTVSPETASAIADITAGIVESALVSPETARAVDRDISLTVPTTTGVGTGSIATASTTGSAVGIPRSSRGIPIATGGDTTVIGPATVEISVSTAVSSGADTDTIGAGIGTASVSTPEISPARAVTGSGAITAESTGTTIIGPGVSSSTSDTTPVTADAGATFGTVERTALGAVSPTHVDAYDTIASGELFRSITVSVSPTVSIATDGRAIARTTQQASGAISDVIASPAGSVGSRRTIGNGVVSEAITVPVRSGTGTSTIVDGLVSDVAGSGTISPATTATRAGFVETASGAATVPDITMDVVAGRTIAAVGTATLPSITMDVVAGRSVGAVGSSLTGSTVDLVLTADGSVSVATGISTDVSVVLDIRAGTVTESVATVSVPSATIDRFVSARTGSVLGEPTIADPTMSRIVPGSITEALGYGNRPNPDITAGLAPTEARALPFLRSSTASSTDGTGTRATAVPELVSGLVGFVAGQPVTATSSPLISSVFREGIAGSVTAAVGSTEIVPGIASSTGGTLAIALGDPLDPITRLTIVGAITEAVGSDSESVADTTTTADGLVSDALGPPVVVQPRMDRTITVGPSSGRGIPEQSIPRTSTTAVGSGVDIVATDTSGFGLASSTDGTRTDVLGTTRIPTTDTLATAVVDTSTGIVSFLVPRTSIVVTVGPSPAVGRPEVPTTRLTTTVGPMSATGTGLDVDGLSRADGIGSIALGSVIPFQAFEDVDVRTHRVPLIGPIPASTVDNAVDIGSTGVNGTDVRFDGQNNVEVLTETSETTQSTVDRDVKILGGNQTARVLGGQTTVAVTNDDNEVRVLTDTSSTESDTVDRDAIVLSNSATRVNVLSD